MTVGLPADPGAAWVTGGGRGIGRALALRLAALGWKVAISARTAEDLEAVAAEAAGLAGRILPVPLDITREAAVLEAVATIESALGPLDLAVLNAGTHLPVTLGKFSSAPFRQLVEVNLMGTVHGLVALLPRFRERRAGHVAVVASLAGYRGLPTAAAYGASKAALIALCESLKPECDALGIGLSLINPGFVKTPLTDRNDFPMPFLVSADDAAKAIVRGLRKGSFEIAFPWRFALLMKLLRILPDGPFFRIAGRMRP